MLGQSCGKRRRTGWLEPSDLMSKSEEKNSWEGGEETRHERRLEGRGERGADIRKRFCRGARILVCK